MKERFHDLLSRFFAGELTPREREDFYNMIAADEECRAEYRKLLEVRSHTLAYHNTDSVRKPSGREIRRVRRPLPLIARRWISAAAAVVLFVSTSLSTLYIYRHITERRLSGQVVLAEAPSDSKSRIVLPDGSVVFLNAGSKLSFDNNFGNGARNLTLDGEGYFEVARDSGKPFNVNVGEAIQVTVLGTKFNINGYEGNSSIVTTLLEGSVEVTDLSTDRKVLLRPDEAVTFDRQSGEMAMESLIDGSLNIMWQTGYWKFDLLALDKLCVELERIYGVEIEIGSGKRAAQRVTGVVYRDEPIERILDLLWRAVGITYRYDDGRVILE